MNAPNGKFFLAHNPWRGWKRKHLVRGYSLVRGGLLVPVVAKCGRNLSPTQVSREALSPMEWQAKESRLCARCRGGGVR